ncbi:hypothetical protein [Stakelama tenebrarum]|uniref:DUF2262 domain-containing protein n=1 Tax=Stakelama tenebrarum TaxID=2711215 RepID=A0A6G6Y7T4_9SPHN|nr:hypothetical protein [Sphingosinithalassobacter tenebrarum]QIG80633.1 hypothetical protein G5C33_13135 [Sphingosinithalassobacter tenebrarum]
MAQETEPAGETREVTGIVGREGPALVETERGNELVFQLFPWRADRGKVSLSRLSVVTQTHEPIETWFDRLSPGAPVSIRGFLPDWESSHGLVMTAWLGPARDPALAAAVQRWNRDQSLRHPAFKAFDYDIDTDQFSVTARWSGKPMQLVIERPEREPLQAIADLAARLFDDSEVWDMRIESWLRREMPDSGVADCVRLKRVTVSGRDRVELLYDDGDALGGRNLIAEIDLGRDVIVTVDVIG